MQRTVLHYIILLALIATRVGAQDNFNDNARKYIDQYASLAMYEQKKNGIPAAITLGQGILETEAGTSELMTEANNHFGIKCKNGWTGETFTHTDDAPNECFKKYGCAADSYKDHSEHLKRNPRYAPLFNIPKTNYAGWAVCLRKCGYATNPQYAQRLIKIIEDFGLQQYTYTAFDSAKMNTVAERPVVNARPPATDSPRKVMAATVKDTTKPAARPAPQIIITHDRHEVKEGETLASIARMEGVEVKKIQEYNFLYPNEEPVVGSVLELQKQARRKPDVRVVATAAHQGNAIVGQDEKGQNGDYVTIDRSKPKPTTTSPLPASTSAPTVASATTPAPAQPASPAPAHGIRKQVNKPAQTDETPDPQKERQLANLKAELDKVVYADDSRLIAENAPPPAPAPVKKTEAQPRAATPAAGKYYTVKHGDTAFSIAKRNNITVAQLLKWNNMEAGDVKTGQRLQVKE